MRDALAWIAPLFFVLGGFYIFAVFMACMELNIEQDHPARGIVWNALPIPFAWAWRAARFALSWFLPPARPRLSRAELERRIEELERDVLDRAYDPLST